jgi:dUTP pyrophosphatase
MIYNIGDKVSYKGHMGIVVNVDDNGQRLYLVAFFEEMDNSSITITPDGAVWDETLILREEDLSPMIYDDELYFAKVKPSAIIPSKRDEDAAYDIYACFDDDYLVIPPHKTILIPTGIATVFSPKWVALLRERGSNGSKGIAQRAGVIDSGYRGEWFVPLTNTNRVPVVIVKKGVELPLMYNDAIIYPYEKGIAQLLMVEVPKLRTKEISYEELQKYTSLRGTGALGSSGK